MQPGIRQITAREFQGEIRNPAYTHLLGSISPRRAGVLLFTVRLEYLHFPPNTESNKDFQLLMVKWEDMLWVAIRIPKEKMEIAKTVAEETGIRIADGVPTVISSTRTRQIVPGNAMNVFALENIPGHPVYKGAHPQVIRAEDEEIRRIIEDAGKHN
jgi:hypothetical protein